MKQNDLIQKYNKAVPRYTSYPTAVQFTEENNSDHFTRRLKNLPADSPISLYVHIPFCHQLCHYCGCNTKIVSHRAPIESYITTLIQEIHQSCVQLTHKPPVSRIHFGGGSPNYASIDNIKDIIETFKRYFDCSQMDIDMECDPRLLNEEKIKAYAHLGITRVSLGVQDFDPCVQKAINRIQPFSTIEKHVQTLRKHGIDAINFDLIIGLPEQSLRTVQDTLDKVKQLKPSRIAVFPYAHVPWMKKHQKLLEQFPMPNSEQRFAMGQMMHTQLTQAGYNAIGIDHFALQSDTLTTAQKAGTMRRNFQGYTDDPSDVILGFGISAISQFKDYYAQNTTDAPTYRKTIQAQKRPTAKALELSEDDINRRALIMQIMGYFQADLKDFPNIPVPHDALRALEQDGIITFSNQILTITDKGMPFVRLVAACFDAYFQPATNRHAKAV